ncbi:hypothetical protein [Streptococcus macacae]
MIPLQGVFVTLDAQVLVSVTLIKKGKYPHSMDFAHYLDYLL